MGTSYALSLQWTQRLALAWPLARLSLLVRSLVLIIQVFSFKVGPVPQYGVSISPQECTSLSRNLSNTTRPDHFMIISPHVLHSVDIIVACAQSCACMSEE